MSDSMLDFGHLRILHEFKFNIMGTIFSKACRLIAYADNIDMDMVIAKTKT